MNVLIDSSVWIEFFRGGPIAERCTHYFSQESRIVTPTVVLYEVYKKIKRDYGEEVGLQFTGRMKATQVVPLTDSIALLAADLSLRHGLAMADAIVYATGLDKQVEVVTRDADLKDLPGVVYIQG